MSQNKGWEDGVRAKGIRTMDIQKGRGGKKQGEKGRGLGIEYRRSGHRLEAKREKSQRKEVQGDGDRVYKVVNVGSDCSLLMEKIWCGLSKCKMDQVGGIRTKGRDEGKQGGREG